MLEAYSAGTTGNPRALSEPTDSCRLDHIIRVYYNVANYVMDVEEYTLWLCIVSNGSFKKLPKLLPIF